MYTCITRPTAVQWTFFYTWQTAYRYKLLSISVYKYTEYIVLISKFERGNRIFSTCLYQTQTI